MRGRNAHSKGVAACRNRGRVPAAGRLLRPRGRRRGERGHRLHSFRRDAAGDRHRAGDLPRQARLILCVRHEESVPLGVAQPALEKSGTEWAYLDAWKERKWPRARELSGLIGLGGSMNVEEIDAYPFLAVSRHLVGGWPEE